MSRSRYRTPIVLATRLATKDETVVKAVVRACKGFSQDHPEWAISKEASHSLSKRIEGQLRVEFSRLISDRYILDWLEKHRGEWEVLAQLPGGLRKAITEEMDRRGELP